MFVLCRSNLQLPPTRNQKRIFTVFENTTQTPSVHAPSIYCTGSLSDPPAIRLLHIVYIVLWLMGVGGEMYFRWSSEDVCLGRVTVASSYACEYMYACSCAYVYETMCVHCLKPCMHVV